MRESVYGTFLFIEGKQPFGRWPGNGQALCFLFIYGKRLLGGLPFAAQQIV